MRETKTAAPTAVNNRPPPATFTSLPPELITRIALLGDLSAALSLTRVCRHFSVPSERRIWEDLDFTVSPEHGEAEYDSSEDERMAEERYSIALGRKARRIRRYGEGRMAMVRKMKVIPRAGVSNVIMKVLEEVAPRLRELEMEGRPRDARGYEWRPNEHDMLDLRILDECLSFPALTHVTIANFALRFCGLVPLLCYRAPALVWLNLSIDQYIDDYAWDTPGRRGFPRFKEPTSLRWARVAYRMDGEDDGDTASSILALVKCSPHLGQFLFPFDVGGIADVAYDLLREHDSLRDLCLGAGIEGPHPRLELNRTKFVSLRRLVLTCDSWASVFDSEFALPSLEILHFYYSSPYPSDAASLLTPTSSQPFADTSPAQRMPPNFARQLKAAPHLHIINILDTNVIIDDVHLFPRLDVIEKSGKVTGRVRSICYGGSELLHASMLLNHTWRSGRCQIDGNEVPQNLTGRIWHTSQHNAMRRKVLPGRPSAIWHNLTYWEGLTVPLEVVREMMEVESLEDGWQGRGREVGPRAWKVLLDWRAGLPAEQN